MQSFILKELLKGPKRRRLKPGPDLQVMKARERKESEES